MARKRISKSLKTEIQILPNPAIPRFPVVKECFGQKEIKDGMKKIIQPFIPACNKIYTHIDNRQVCMAYENPAEKQRLGCQFTYAPTPEEIKAMNPQKASKKKARNR